VTAPPIALHRELARKTIHLLSAAAPLAYAGGVPRRPLLWALGAAAVAAVVIEGARRARPAAQQVLDRTVGPLFRAHEHASVTGATWLMLALFAAAVTLPRDLAIATMWAAAVGDPAAALVGRVVGRVRFRPDGKSLEGSLACLATTFAGAVLVARLGPGSAGAAGLVAALAEWPRGPLDDNIRIVLGVGATLVALRMFAA
jgi:dolichol kinase